MSQRVCQRLGREDVVVQPVQQLAPVAGDHAGLGVVQVAVDEAGQHQMAAVVVEGGGLKHPGR